ncbi:MAG: DNA replication/repair protein RecF [Ignavibacteria bacterium]|nr:DNA replication/repair protein RecF [Ignavibacteria bacterium]
MILTRLRLTHLRNHRHSEIDCPQGIVLLWGENGAGKTSILEAVSMLCTSRSFVSTQDRTLVAKGEETLRVEGAFQTDNGVAHTVSFAYPGAANRKAILLDNAPLESVAELFGRFPLVTLSPQHRAITSGGPAERRGFLDFVVSQVNHAYLLDLMEYRRVLRHRNALLAAHERRTPQLDAQLEPWDSALAACAVRIVRRRASFITEYQPYFIDAMRSIVDGREAPTFRYRNSAEIDTGAADAADAFRGALERSLHTDVRRGTTSIGPHRDDLDILLNGMDVRAHASQGQHKTLLISLKVGEWFFLNDHLDERPMFLLDDVFSELDDARLARILRIIPSLGQTFITTANQSILQHVPDISGGKALYRVDGGTILAYAEAA